MIRFFINKRKEKTAAVIPTGFYIESYAGDGYTFIASGNDKKIVSDIISNWHEIDEKKGKERFAKASDEIVKIFEIFQEVEDIPQ